ncbi:phage tail assembly protein [Ancylobacter amanitiformis]|uniref:Phage tail assembly protein n=1 Tax=Ancylobacter amanitiformis TaxID=217069 RepID=A0ABU0LQF0_9HYPH|nr:phage tail assembly protein [Ancylobacter amanitiformis]MDQ0510870.1 hypothetical protein [Ancylobacter amanitiformis]
MSEKNTLEHRPAPPRLLGNRSEPVPLEFPVEYDGRTWTSITVSRLSTPQITQFFEAVLADDKTARLPMFDAPPEVIDALDPDDADKIEEVVQRFLPRRLRPAAGQSPEGGASTSPSSEAS